MSLRVLALLALVGASAGSVICATTSSAGCTYLVNFAYSNMGTCNANTTATTVAGSLTATYCCVTFTCSGRSAALAASSRSLLQGTSGAGQVTTTSAANAASIQSTINSLTSLGTPTTSVTTNSSSGSKKGLLGLLGLLGLIPLLLCIALIVFCILKKRQPKEEAIFVPAQPMMYDTHCPAPPTIMGCPDAIVHHTL